MALTLNEAILRKNNNFDIIRLIAALMVLYSHSFLAFPTNGFKDPVQQLLIKDHSGGLAVMVFFFLSGIFIPASFLNSSSVKSFIRMRLFRIWPALMVCILITVFIVGPVFTGYSLNSYFINIQTWKYVMNIFLIRLEPGLPDVFASNIFNESVNGSLWTLPVEIRCYFVILIMGIFRLLNKRVAIITVFIIVVLFRHNPSMIYIFESPAAPRLLMFFLIGLLAYTYREYVTINYKIALALIVICVLSYFINHKLFTLLFFLSMIYSLLVIGTLEFLKKIKLPGDYSYGIYLYGFLIQQIIAASIPGLTAYSSMLICFPVTILSGILSWHFVELPALNFSKKKIYCKEG